MILLTVSGGAWLLLGYPFTFGLVVKLMFVAALWALGPLIDRWAEPAFRRLSPAPDEPASQAFIRAQTRYLVLEAVATLLF